MNDRQSHWNAVYEETPTDELGWYEPVPGPSLDLITTLDLDDDARILDAGAGATTLIDHLLERGYQELVAVDLSEVGLQRLARRIGPDRAERVAWIVGDLTDPSTLADISTVDLWHDRAVLHFLTEEADRKGYLQSLRSTVRPGGHVIIATFSPEGAERCSGLPVRRYEAEGIAELLGPEFELLRDFEYLYRQPSGDPRPYVYTLFRRAED